MEKHEIEGMWKQWKGKAHEEWGDLTDQEMEEVEGQREQLVGKLQQHYGWTKDETERRVDDWQTRMEMSSQSEQRGDDQRPYVT